MKTILFIAVNSIIILSYSQGGSGLGCQITDDWFSIMGRDDNCNPDPFRLVYEDNFDGNKLDLTFWDPLNGLPTGNIEKEYYQPSNITVSDGFLRILTKKESLGNKTWSFWNGTQMEDKSGNFEYSSGWMVSKFKFPYGYGKFEARIKIPASNSLRPAFWLYGDNASEIDIFEFFEDNTKMSMTVRRNVGSTERQCGEHTFLSNSQPFSDGFHIYSAVWTPWFIEFFCDGIPIWTHNKWLDVNTDNVKCPHSDGQYLRKSTYPQDALVIKINTKVTNEDNSLASSPQEMLVDWVRVYYELPCADVTITDPADIPQSDGIYNFVFGKNVNINCNYTIPNNKPLAIIGSESVIINGSITTSSGSYFFTTIREYSDCNNQSAMPLPSKTSDTIPPYRTEFLLYPNPIQDQQILNFFNLETDYGEKIEITITDLHGRDIEKGQIIAAYFNRYVILAPLTTGVYYCKLKYSNGVNYVYKFMRI